MATILDYKHAMVKYAKAHHFKLDPEFSLANPRLGPAARRSIITIKEHAGIRPHDGNLNTPLQHALAKYLPKPPPPPKPTKSEMMAREGWWWIGHSEQCDYAEDRPIPYHQWKAREYVVTDCSGSYSCIVYTVGLTDANGYGFNGAGNTNSLLEHMRHIDRHEAIPGTCVIFGYPGITEHVSMLLEDAGTVADPLVFNHGHAGAPDEPEAEHLSGLLDYFDNVPHTYCTPFN